MTDDSPAPAYAVLTDRADIQTEHGWAVTYTWDRKTFPNEGDAVSHGIRTTDAHGEFTVAVILGGELVRLHTPAGYEILHTRGELRDIARRTGIEPAPKIPAETVYVVYRAREGEHPCLRAAFTREDAALRYAEAKGARYHMEAVELHYGELPEPLVFSVRVALARRGETCARDEHARDYATFPGVDGPPDTDHLSIETLVQHEGFADPGGPFTQVKVSGYGAARVEGKLAEVVGNIACGLG